MPMVADIGYAMGPLTAASQSVKQVGVEGSDPTDRDTERGGSADDAKKGDRTIVLRVESGPWYHPNRL